MSTASVVPRSRNQKALLEVGEICRARNIVARLGGRFSLELGIAVDCGPGEIERWALAATLVGDPSPLSVSVHAYRAMERAGIATFADVLACDRERLARVLDEGGYVGDDETTASRLLALAEARSSVYPEGVAALGQEIQDPLDLERELGALPGWDREIVRAFLRELRGIWPGAGVPLDPRAALAARHAALPCDLGGLSEVADDAHLDVRDLEAGLTRLALSHDPAHCPGGEECPVVHADREQFVRF
jgi:hypothetical protein